MSDVTDTSVNSTWCVGGAWGVGAGGERARGSQPAQTRGSSGAAELTLHSQPAWLGACACPPAHHSPPPHPPTHAPHAGFPGTRRSWRRRATRRRRRPTRLRRRCAACCARCPPHCWWWPPSPSWPTRNGTSEGGRGDGWMLRMAGVGAQCADAQHAIHRPRHRSPDPSLSHLHHPHSTLPDQVDRVWRPVRRLLAGAAGGLGRAPRAAQELPVPPVAPRAHAGGPGRHRLPGGWVVGARGAGEWWVEEGDERRGPWRSSS